MKKETVLGVDLGGTKILIGELDQAGNILESKSFRSKVTSQVEAVEQIKEVIASYLENEKLQGQLIGTLQTSGSQFFDHDDPKTVDFFEKLVKEREI